MNTFKKILNGVIVSFFLFFGASLPISTYALGQISKPIIIKNALRGQDYIEEIVIFNTEKNNIKAELAVGGDIQGWVKFYQLDDSPTPIPTTETTIKGSSNLKLNAIIHIPESAPNGEYNGLISAISKPDAPAASTESVVYLSQKIDRPVSITVSDNEIVKMDVSVIPNEYDLIKGEDLSLRIIYNNQGNIYISPQAQVKIKKDEKIIYNIIYPYPEEVDPVKPNQHYEIEPIILRTNGYEKGEYIAELDFLINNKPIINKRFAFSYGVYNSGERYSVAGYIKNNIFINYVKDNVFLINIFIAAVILMATITALITKKQIKIKKDK